jgi:hypothetical protein
MRKAKDTDVSCITGRYEKVLIKRSTWQSGME